MNPPIERCKCSRCGEPAVLVWIMGALCTLHRHLFFK